MTAVVAIIGRPNVGKSSLFNVLTGTRDALVVDTAGTTRDRIYGRMKIRQQEFILIDTGGIGDDLNGIEQPLEQQALQALEESQLILMLVDGAEGLTTADEKIADILRKSNKDVILIANKSDRFDPDIALSDFYGFGFHKNLAISAAHHRGISDLRNEITLSLEHYFAEEEAETEENPQAIRTAIVGRPNVGKSTLVNRMLGEDRVVVYDRPGTTTDSISIPFERYDRAYTLIDTAGVRRKGKTEEGIEKLSVVKTLQAIDKAHVVIFVVDAQEGLTEQDGHLLGFVLESGRSMIVTINKWDGLPHDQRDKVKQELEYKLRYVNFAPVFFISALHGTNVGLLFKAVDKCYDSAMQDLSTPRLSKILEAALDKAQPPVVHGRRIKLRYAHLGGRNPPRIVVHGNQTERLPHSYIRFLENFYRETLDLYGTPIKVEMKQNKNPFAGKRNLLTPRQIIKRKRLMNYVKKKK